MERKSFKTLIDAPREKVWAILWNDNTYPDWAAAFCEGSVARTDWNEGSKVLFLDAAGSGMASVIEKKTPDQFMSFRHLGEVKAGVEDYSSAEAKPCSGGIENYTLSPVDGRTLLEVDMDLFPGMEEYFMRVWPQALSRVKELAEKA